MRWKSYLLVDFFAITRFVRAEGGRHGPIKTVQEKDCDKYSVWMIF